MYVLWHALLRCIRSCVKCFLRRFTGLCELQRICYGTVEGAARTTAVEYSLFHSKSPFLVRAVNHLNGIADDGRLRGDNESQIVASAVSTVLVVKRINPTVHAQFVDGLRKCILQIWGYRQLLADVEELRKTAFDADSAQHTTKLFDLWHQLVPDIPIGGRVTKQWQDIGFQGDDPKTDFRGMGMLGLENLRFFASEYNEAARCVLSHSHHPTLGYAFAIVGINITHLTWSLFNKDDAKHYVYNIAHGKPDLRVFHQLYSNIFYQFDKFWISSKPTNMMEFPIVWRRFERVIHRNLTKHHTVFKESLLCQLI